MSRKEEAFSGRLILNILTIANIGEGSGAIRTLIIASETINWFTHFGKLVAFNLSSTYYNTA